MSRLRPLIREEEVRWDPEFSRRRSLNFKDLGKSYVEWKAGIGEDLAAAQAALLQADIVPIFMRDDEDSKISVEADTVEAFCQETTLSSLLTLAKDGGPSLEPVALLDEETLDGGIISTLHHRGPLTALQLYYALKEPRFRPSATQPSNKTEEVWDVRRRRIFITDLDCWGICAIVGTALRYQKTAIRSVLYGHLRFKPWIHADIPSEGRKFQLVFHLPYMPMRDSDAPNIDTRRFTNGRLLRGHQNVSFLNLTGSHSVTHRYEAQISFMMIGTDDLTWDTYCFEDTYFDPFRCGKRLVEFYDESSQGADGTWVAIDPSTRGRTESAAPILDARLYFLTVLRDSLEDVTREWKRSVDLVDDSIRDYRQSQHDLQNHSKKRLSSRKVQGLSSIEWITQVKDLSNTLLMRLSALIDIMETFFINREPLFHTDLCNPVVSKIADVLEDLEILKKTLESDVKHCEILFESQQIWLNQETTEAGRKNQFISKFIYPVVIGVGMFSMKDHVLPFKANTATFVCVVFVVGVLIRLAYDPSRCWQEVLDVTDKVCSKEHFQGMRVHLRALLRTKPARPASHDQSVEFLARTFPWRRRNPQPVASPGPVIEV